MPPRNIEVFNRIVAVTLVTLYEAFPNPIDLAGIEIGRRAAEGFAPDEAEQFQLMMETAGNAIGFLVREGFVHYEANSGYIDGPEFPSACLTLKGFTLLGRTPDAVNETVERRPFIEQLHDALEEGANITTSQVVQSLFFGAIRLGAAAVGLG